jgi:hypothetical protein
MLFIASYGFSQSVNNYKAVIIPIRYGLQKTENQYRLQTLTKFNLEKAGFHAYYNNEVIPAEFNDRCSLLYLDVIKENAFLATKLFIILKDCNNATVFKSAIGMSRKKEFELAYSEALNEAFKSVYALRYKYSGGASIGAKSSSSPTVVVPPVAAVPAIPALAVPVATSKNEVSDLKISENKSADLLYAQPTSYGYQLIDSEPKVVMKVYKTSNPASYMATKGSIQGVLVSKDNQWFFEYYQGDKLISEKIDVKF